MKLPGIFSFTYKNVGDKIDILAEGLEKSASHVINQYVLLHKDDKKENMKLIIKQMNDTS